MNSFFIGDPCCLMYSLTDDAAAETVYQNVQSPIPDDQWVIELSNWFAVGLAGFQQSSLEYAMGPQYLGKSGVIERPAANDTLAQRLCHSQVIRNSSQVQYFSFLGIILILTIGGILLVTSMTLESSVGRLQRRFHVGELRRVNWIMDEKLQLIDMSAEADTILEKDTGSVSQKSLNNAAPAITNAENSMLLCSLNES